MKLSDKKLRWFWFALVPVVLLRPASSTTQQSAPRLELKPCSVQGISGNARCGTFEVFENRATEKGRKISLKILVLPATGANPQPDPFIYFAGGPGSAATEEAVGVAGAFKALRELRDMVF